MRFGINWWPIQILPRAFTNSMKRIRLYRYTTMYPHILAMWGMRVTSFIIKISLYSHSSIVFILQTQNVNVVWDLEVCTIFYWFKTFMVWNCRNGQRRCTPMKRTNAEQEHSSWWRKLIIWNEWKVDRLLLKFTVQCQATRTDQALEIFIHILLMIWQYRMHYIQWKWATKRIHYQTMEHVWFLNYAEF